MFSIKKRILLVFSLVLLISLGAACSSEDNSNTSESGEGKTAENNGERTLEDATGEVTIPADPERIIAPYLEDSLLALGITPAAQWSIGDTVLDYLQPQLKGVPKVSYDLPLEQAISHDPDLIVFSSPSAIQNGQREEYLKIAPTFVLKEEVNADWRQQLLQMGKIVDKEDDAEKTLAQYDEKAAEAKAKIKDAIGDETAAIIWVMGEQFYLFENNRYSATVLYNDLGIQQPSFVESLPEAGVQWDPISLEKLAELDADHIFLVSKENEPGLEILANSSIWQGLPAVTQNHVYEMNDPSHWTINGLIAHEMTMDEVVKALTK
ncbi:ferrichrome ABC transporter substrate-binding protein [Bacillus canaveralius]|uniref:Ferrichrome ABC transporter substrate-binding protein n=1 Tax=Bacillus canaveralius TaxID=1403243 RepID=A0A2N5GS04_9BACI|nr:ABC transporter substrate-binding protein [Bacillus canaveralius]PLR86340.1 ferrichrome ABC transporter substrate-binding protein [Bacillus canaveralius]PLR98573.1 ferrichrome ABC transporter substrate-binding protein [Bacillus canaveralius]